LLAEIGPTPLVDNWLPGAAGQPQAAPQAPAPPWQPQPQAPAWQPQAPAPAWQPQAPVPAWQPQTQAWQPQAPGYQQVPGYPAQYGQTPAPGYPAEYGRTREQARRSSRSRLAWAGGMAVAACLAAAAVLVGIHVAHAAGKPRALTTAVGYDAALGAVVRPSGRKGGTIVYDNSNSPDSTDPGNMYDAFSWDFSRLYTMPLMTTKSCPGSAACRSSPISRPRRARSAATG
jgi:hypothetical protein